MIGQKFKLYFQDKVFQKNDFIYPGAPYYYTPWYLKILGFSYWWECKVVSDPKLVGDNWTYDVQYIKTKLKWFKWTVKHIKDGE